MAPQRAPPVGSLQVFSAQIGVNNALTRHARIEHIKADVDQVLSSGPSFLDRDRTQLDRSSLRGPWSSLRKGREAAWAGVSRNRLSSLRRGVRGDDDVCRWTSCWHCCIAEQGDGAGRRAEKSGQFLFLGNICCAHEHLVHMWCTWTNKVYKNVEKKFIHILSTLLQLFAKISSSNSYYIKSNKKTNF
jgi:hypothetical protein